MLCMMIAKRRSTNHNFKKASRSGRFLFDGTDAFHGLAARHQPVVLRRAVHSRRTAWTRTSRCVRTVQPAARLLHS
jgi:hypothetical protein